MQHLYPSPAALPLNFGLNRDLRSVLVVMPGYAAASDPQRRIGEGRLWLRALGVAWKVLSNRDRRGYIAEYRDFYANPRTQEYMAERVGEVLNKGVSADAKLSFLVRQDSAVSAGLQSRGEVSATLAASRMAERVACAIDERGPFDAVLLVHCDGLGLGLYRLEEVLAARFPDATFVINGRRRIYHLTPKMRGKLALRRFLADTRILESSAGLLVPPYASSLARRGMIRGTVAAFGLCKLRQ